MSFAFKAAMVAGIEIQLHAVLVANDGDIVPLRSVRQGEPEHAVKGQGAFEIAYADADMIDAFNCEWFRSLRPCEPP